MKWILPLLASSLCFADFEDHLRTLPEKTGDHTMRGIDCIYLINLDERPEKLAFSLKQLEPYGINPFRVSAVNGWNLTLDEINDIGLRYSFGMQGGFMGTSYLPGGNFEPYHSLIENYGQTYFCHCMARGAMGCALSHLSIMQDAYDAGYETIWIIEDDIEVLQNPHILSDLIEELDQLVGKNGWDFLFTDRDIRDANGNHKTSYWAARRPDLPETGHVNDYALKRKVGDHFCQIGSRWGSTSQIVRRSGMKKLLQYFKAHQLFFPYDMEFILPYGIKLYAVEEDVVSNYPKAASDNGGPNYLNAQ
ncbi:MAG: glycosyltransferase family 25 protein [Verrucomicrobia bacterium]|nr:glycosyltransferase family 25 protein [Verrucomicrobiota bacterium]